MIIGLKIYHRTKIAEYEKPLILTFQTTKSAFKASHSTVFSLYEKFIIELSNVVTNFLCYLYGQADRYE